MNAEELKHKLREILGNQIWFNKEFDDCADLIKTAESIISWCSEVKAGKERAIRAPRADKNIVFIKKIGSSHRCIILKVVNGEFKEVHLGNHFYYDVLRKQLGLKKDSIR